MIPISTLRGALKVIDTKPKNNDDIVEKGLPAIAKSDKKAQKDLDEAEQESKLKTAIP